MASIRNYEIVRNPETGKIRITFEHNNDAQDGGWIEKQVIVPDDLERLGRKTVEPIMLQLAKIVAGWDGELRSREK